MTVELQGDILRHRKSAALVNPVNTVGAMGRGLALQFKRRYPEMDREYRRLCNAGLLQPGHVFFHSVAPPGAMPEWVVSFPTKQHWRNPSRMDWIRDGLADLYDQLKQRSITSVAIPALGAGLGGLPWAPVRECIIAAADENPSITTTIITLEN